MVDPTPVIRERPTGFTVAFAGCPAVTISRRTTYFAVESRSTRERQRFGLYETQPLVKTILEMVQRQWKPPSGARTPLWKSHRR